MTKGNNKVKNLSLTEIKKQAKKLDKKTEYEIAVGDEIYKIKIDDVFTKTKQNLILEDLVTLFEEGYNRKELLHLATPYVMLLLIKHFTSIEVSDDIDEALELLNALIDLEVLDTILNLMPEKEVINVYELVKVTTDRMKENMDEAKSEMERLSETVENDEVKDLFLNGKGDKKLH